MNKQFTDFFEAWWYLNEHERFQDPRFKSSIYQGMMNLFTQSLCIEVVKVNPETNCIDDDDSKNTKVQVWLESGEPFIDEEHDHQLQYYHTLEYDSGGDTFEEAIIDMANNVYEHGLKTENE